jgi:hypothetical protein
MIDLSFLGFSAHAKGEVAVCSVAVIAIVFLVLRWHRSGAKPGS